MKNKIMVVSFLHHPAGACMTYTSHCCFSLSLSLIFLRASAQALVHAVFPFWCPHSSQTHCRQILLMIQENGCPKED